MRLLMSLICLVVFSAQGISQQAESFRTSDGETLYYTRVGKGPRVILLYGGPGYGVNIMRPWADSLSRKYECILYEQRGTGLSANVKLDSTTINIARAAHDLEDLRKHFGDAKLVLCGISWGGALAQIYASFYPDNVSKIVLVSSLGPDRGHAPAFGDNLRMRRYPAEADSLNYWNNQPQTGEASINALTYFFLPYFYDHTLGRRILKSELPKASSNPVMSKLMTRDIAKHYDLKEALKKYKGACVIIKPRQDVIPEEMAFRIKAVLPQSEIITIERCGHFPDWEKPQELYRILRRVL